jgi:hypothetical protein
MNRLFDPFPISFSSPAVTHGFRHWNCDQGRPFVPSRLIAASRDVWLLASLVQDDTQERSVDLKRAIVLDETELPEFVHEKIDAWARGPDHLSQCFLGNLGEYSVRLVVLAVTGKQQKSPCQSFLTGVKELVHQIFLNADVSGQHMRDEEVREGVFHVERAHHLIFLDE